MRALLPAALTVAALAAIESLLSARVAASLADTGAYDPDRELLGQGLASLAAGLFGGMPATGAIARTAVNVRSGARTRASAAAHAVVLLAVVLVVAGPVAHIPLAALSGVLMVTAVRMVHVATARSILRSTRADAAAFLVTAVVTVSVDLIVAVGIGVIVAGAFALRGLARATGVAREPVPGEPEAGDEQIAVVRIDGPLFFAAADRVRGKQSLGDELLRFGDQSVIVLLGDFCTDVGKGDAGSGEAEDLRNAPAHVPRADYCNLQRHRCHRLLSVMFSVGSRRRWEAVSATLLATAETGASSRL